MIAVKEHAIAPNEAQADALVAMFNAHFGYPNADAHTFAIPEKNYSGADWAVSLNTLDLNEAWVREALIGYTVIPELPASWFPPPYYEE